MYFVLSFKPIHHMQYEESVAEYLVFMMTVRQTHYDD